MLNLRESDIQFIKNNIGKDSEMLKTDNKRVFLDILYSWIDDYGFEDDGCSYNNLGRTAQKVYDYVYDNN